MRSAFDEWFTEQFGPHPWPDVDEEVLKAHMELGAYARRKIADIERYEQRRRAALTAWRAREVEDA